MNRIFAVLLGAAAMGVSAANAADLPVKAPPLPAPVLYNWSGCYIGGHAGGGWARTDWTNLVNDSAFGDLIPGESISQRDSGFIGGGQIGCNYQTGPWVFGIEGTFAGSTIDGDVVTVDAAAVDDVFTTEINSIATVTGRIGYAWDNLLLYFKGGYAGADIELTVVDPFTPGAGSDSDWHSGWTVGVGLEYGWTPNWIIGVEYGFIDLEERSHDVGDATGAFVFDGDTEIHQVVARLSYKFW